MTLLLAVGCFITVSAFQVTHDFYPLKKKIFKKTNLIWQLDKKEKDQTLEKISKLQQATKMSASKSAKMQWFLA